MAIRANDEKYTNKCLTCKKYKWNWIAGEFKCLIKCCRSHSEYAESKWNLETKNREG